MVNKEKQLLVVLFVHCFSVSTCLYIDMICPKNYNIDDKYIQIKLAKEIVYNCLQKINNLQHTQPGAKEYRADQLSSENYTLYIGKILDFISI